MEVFSVSEFQDRWDELITRVEGGETLGVVNSEGQACVLVREDLEILTQYRINNNEAS
jgi:PHD/YefM family antitoxin component YafN of YafNO toxin-antitoxin module|tara:strand:+ start:437 stop:610 length:174 start_codon:yes stop_codon:yes gene_type:complete